MAYGTAGGKVTGFASPAQGYEDTTIDLNSMLIRRPAATFFFRLESGDMGDLGLHNGALLVVDRSKNAVPNDFVLLAHEGRFLCRLFALYDGVKVFTNGMSDIIPIVDETAIIGVVTASIQVYGNDIPC
jgi:DNA polymerase V